MADEENKVVASNATGNAAVKSVKKKTVKKKAVKKSVKKKSVKKAAKKAVKKKPVAATKASSANGNGQKEKAKIRLKDDTPNKEKAQKIASASTVKVPANQKKDSLGLLSTLSIALLFIVGIWAVVSYMSDQEAVSEVAVEVPATEAVVTEAAVAEAVATEEQAEESVGFFDILFGT